MTSLPPSNLLFLKRAFNEIIQSERNADQTGKTSSFICQRHTFIFIDGSCLSITEFINHNKIDYYHYDWYSKSNKILLKFHSESHTDEELKTDTEPFHIHAQGIKGEKRLANPIFKDLYSVMQFIRIYLMVSMNNQ